MVEISCTAAAHIPKCAQSQLAHIRPLLFHLVFLQDRHWSYSMKPLPQIQSPSMWPAQVVLQTEQVASLQGLLKRLSFGMLERLCGITRNEQQGIKRAMNDLFNAHDILCLAALLVTI